MTGPHDIRSGGARQPYVFFEVLRMPAVPRKRAAFKPVAHCANDRTPPSARLRNALP